MLQTDDTVSRPAADRSPSTGVGPAAIKSARQGPHRPARSVQRVSNRPHPVIYKAMAGLVLWFTASAWLFFGSAPHMGLILAIVATLFIMAIGIPFMLWRVGERARSSETRSADQPAEPFAAWIASEFATWTGHQGSVTAAIEILLPIAAVAIGITALGVVFELVAVR